MRKCTFTLLALLTVHNVSWAQTIEWIRQFGIGGTNPAEADGVAADATGIYVVGRVSGALPGQSSAGGQDAFVRKYDAKGNELWTRQFGSTGDDAAWWIAVDSTGVYLVGQAGAALPGQVSAGGLDAYLRKYDFDGNEVWTRQFGTVPRDEGGRVAVNSTGVYVVGLVGDAFPGQTNAGGSDAYVRKYDVNGNEQWTRQFGSAGNDALNSIAMDATGLYVGGNTLGTLPGLASAGGRDAFLRKYDVDGNALWTRQFGSTGPDNAWGLAATGNGVYVTGLAGAALPGQASAGLGDVFLRKYDADGGELWTRQFGTSGNDLGEAVAVDATSVYVAGDAGGALPGQTHRGLADAFLRKYDASGEEKWTLQFGSVNNDAPFAIAVDATGIYAVGLAGGPLPGQTSTGATDAYVAKIIPAPSGSPVVEGILSAVLDTSSTSLAPLGLFTIFGTNLAPVAAIAGGNTLTDTLGGATVEVEGARVPLLYVSPTQINAQLGSDVTSGPKPLIVNNGGGASPPVTATVAPVAPAIFFRTAGGAVVKNADFSLVSASNPARAGDVLVIYFTGGGQTNPRIVSGGVVGFPPLAETAPASVTIGTRAAEVLYSAASPGFVGLYQAAVRMPSGVAPGNAPVILSMGGASSNTVMIAVQ